MNVNYWYAILGILVLLFIVIIIYTKKKDYLYYFIAGAIIGFYFDIVSVSQGYYLYHPYPPVIFGVPLTVTIAEGCAIAITIFIKDLAFKMLLKR
ncbi:TPA: hypothetical protein HA235_00845 [Candidatus Woesearchaeota archaeon]|nr:hypothetical protein [Candidatus Woesearchaeota archaeon]HIH31232.1 hypothetical protein [Candidatus Woesearchaeota archaeon]HIH54655.1 hypothetical protein [Candidatus Woesearchaeota archaeon]HIJ01387.1 hypothetical protein [Candidatus Woesearchaeota archaeon]HIJ14288.1 hypothetical protein [Candidatus Woesearchaeota archaeon]